MKIIHTGDIHLGSAMKNLPTEKASLRKAEILENFRRLTVYARENGVGAVLIAGDLFDEGQSSPALKREVANLISAANPVCFFYVSGNHDDLFAFDEKPDNLYLFSETRSWKSYEFPNGITLTGIDERNLSEGVYSQLRLPPDRYNIVMMHGGIGQEISLAKLQDRYIDYLALGHIHQPSIQAQRIDGRGHYRYCGCLEGRGFDECGKRGFFLLEVEKGRLRSETFLSLSRREISDLSVDISDCKSYYDVERAVETVLKNESRENVVKVRLKGKHTADLKKDLQLLTLRLNERFFYAKVVDESGIFIDYDDFKNDLSERGEFVREVGRYEMNEDFRSEILEVGLKALAGEEIDL